MKKSILFLGAVLCAFSSFAQVSIYTYTVHKTDGSSVSFKVNEFPRIAFTDSTSFDNYPVVDATSSANHWPIEEVSKVTFSVQQVTLNQSAKEAVAEMGLGFNLGNSLDANGDYSVGSPTTAETSWGQPVTTKAMMDFLHAEGFGAVRIPVTWAQHIDDEGNIDAEWMARVKEIVDYAYDDSLYVILNVHHDTGAGSNDWVRADGTVYSQTKDRFSHLWTQIANTFAAYGHHLLFEGYNEMLDASNTWYAPANSSSYDALNAYAQTFVDAVRATGGLNASRNLVINTYAAASNSLTVGGLSLPLDYADKHLAVEFHTYSPWNWFATKSGWDSECSSAIATEISLLHNKFGSDVPVIIGEYGTHGDNNSYVTKNSTATQLQAAADQAADIVRQTKAIGGASFYWMSIFDSTDRTVPQWTLPTVVQAMKDANK